MEELRPDDEGLSQSVFGLIFFAIAGVVTLVFLLSEGLRSVGTLIGGCLAVVGLVIAEEGFRYAAASRRVGEPVISVATSRLPVGGQFVMGYEQTCKRAIQINRIVVQLILRETVQYSRGTDTTTDSHDDVLQEFVSQGRRLMAGEAFRSEYSLCIPENAMHTFAPSPDNRIEWFVKVSVDIADSPDLQREYEITVLPELAR